MTTYMHRHGPLSLVVNGRVRLKRRDIRARPRTIKDDEKKKEKGMGGKEECHLERNEGGRGKRGKRRALSAHLERPACSFC